MTIKQKTTIIIRPATTLAEVQAGYSFLDQQFDLGVQHRRSATFYADVFHETPELLLLALDDDRIIGALYASIEGDHVLAGELALTPAYQRQGLGARLMAMLETQCRSIGQQRIMLGAVGPAEGFYLWQGYRPLLFIQTDVAELRHTIAPLIAAYSYLWEDIQPARYAVILDPGGLDKALHVRIEALSPQIHTQYLFVKELADDRAHESRSTTQPYCVMVTAKGCLLFRVATLRWTMQLLSFSSMRNSR